jgi:hypothetical protein
MPLGILLKKRDDAGQETRGIIDAEINRRLNSRLAIIANLISVLALIVGRRARQIVEVGLSCRREGSDQFR